MAVGFHCFGVCSDNEVNLGVHIGGEYCFNIGITFGGARKHYLITETSSFGPKTLSASKSTHRWQVYVSLRTARGSRPESETGESILYVVFRTDTSIP